MIGETPEADRNSASDPANPKDSIAAGKIPLSLWSPVATALGALALLDGMLKYGRSNYRAVPVKASVYVDAAKRHLDAWFEGEEADPDSGLDHIGHALASLNIIVDARAAGTLLDDRNMPGRYRGAMATLTPHVARLQALYAEREPPRHYTIADQGDRK
jgi:hypothetical protein